MYIGDSLYDSLRGVYVAAIDRAIIAQAKADLEDRLRAMDSGPVRSTENFNRDFDTLKLYLMLGDPDHMDPAWAAPRLVHGWSLTSHARAKGEEELLEPHVTYDLDLLAKKQIRSWELDQKLVTSARSILSQVPQLDRLYESLIRDANTEIAPIRREAVFYGSIAPYVQSKNGTKVPGAYTKQGWLRVRALLGEQRAKLAAEQWVLGDANDLGAAGVVDKLRDLYFERYKKAWGDFVADFQVQDPGAVEVSLEELNALSEPEWPYLRLMRLIADNTVLELEEQETGASGVIDKAIDKAKQLLDGGAPKKRVPSSVERAFRPMVRFGVPAEPAKEGGEPPATQLSQYVALLAKLEGAMTDLQAEQGGTARAKLVKEVLPEVIRSTTALLTEQDGFTRPLLKPLLMRPIEFAAKAVGAGGGGGGAWETGPYKMWKEKLQGKYPFASSPTDVALNDFIGFVAPGDGALWGFYTDSLKGDTVEQRGSVFIATGGIAATPYSSEFLDICLKRGNEITEAIYPKGLGKAAVTFDVNLHSVSASIAEVTFEVDGASHAYRNEPERWMTVTWPGSTGHGATLRVRGAGGLNEEISRPGDFGLFHLLDAAEVKPGRAGGRADGTPTLVATWDLKAANNSVVSLDLRPSRTENPLTPGYFKNYSCPRSITTR
jgi:type VI secretion system protein ImpL